MEDPPVEDKINNPNSEPVEEFEDNLPQDDFVLSKDNILT